MSMRELQPCEECGKPAIGYQSFGCCSAYVCRDHAHTALLALAPGQRLIADEYYLERFG